MLRQFLPAGPLKQFVVFIMSHGRGASLVTRSSNPDEALGKKRATDDVKVFVIPNEIDKDEKSVRIGTSSAICLEPYKTTPAPFCVSHVGSPGQGDAPESGGRSTLELVDISDSSFRSTLPKIAIDWTYTVENNPYY
jgi:hypothetical protein